MQASEVEPRLRPLAASFALFGVFWGLFSVAAADIERDLDLSHSQFGLLLSAALAVAGASNVFVGIAAERRGATRTLAAALCTWGVLLVVSSQLRSTAAFVGAFVLFVAAGGAVDVGLNVLATAAFAGAPGRLVRFHARFNIGAAGGAAAAGALLAAGASWRVGLAGLGVAALVLTPFVLGGRAVVGTNDDHLPLRQALTLLVRERLVLVAVAFALGAIAEGGIELWGVLFLRERLQSGIVLGAGSAVAGYSVAAVARIALGSAAGSLGAARGAAAGAAGAAAGLVLLALAPTTLLAAAGLVVAAAGVSLCWPLLLAHAASGASRSGAVVGAMTSLGYAGIVLGPALAGLVAGTAGLRATLVFLAALAIGAGVAAAVSSRRR